MSFAKLTRGHVPADHCQNAAINCHRKSSSLPVRSSSRSFDCKKCLRTKSAISSPSSFPVVKSERKCTPAKIRLRVASCCAAEKLVNVRSTPGATSEVTLKLKRSRLKKDLSKN